MASSQHQVLLLDQTAEMHEATHVAAHDLGGSRLPNTVELLHTDLAGDFGVRHTERAAKAAALVRGPEFDELHAGHLEQPLRAVAKVDPTAVTRAVEGDFRSGIE